MKNKNWENCGLKKVSGAPGKSNVKRDLPAD
jgi:hypothetical protein